MLHNRDISWLGFNYRVLQEAADETVPLYERMKFLAIFSSNLDEFFRVRYPSIIALAALKEKTKLKAHIEADGTVTEKIQVEVNRQLDCFGTILTGQVIPALKAKRINLYYNAVTRQEHVQEVKEIFIAHVLSFLQPVFLEAKGSPDFLPENNQLYFAVSLKVPGDGLKQAIVNIPSGKIKRFYTLSPLEGEDYVIFLDDIIRENINYLFPGLEIQGIYSIKCNRNAGLNLTEEYSGNLLDKIEKQLKKRATGLPSRFLYEASMPGNLQLFLGAAFDVQYQDMFAGGRYHHLSDFSAFPQFHNTLQLEKTEPLTAAGITDSSTIFAVMGHQDVLLHLPYQSYNPVLSFFNQAAVDADVTEIYITLYRLASESHIVNALINAAKNGKHVVVFIELKARFDEANNIKWSRIMKDAGITLVYSMPQIKVHVKAALVKRKTAHNLLSYALVSTGNFNEVTAQFYTDHVLMTCNEKIISELVMLFTFLEKGHNEMGGAGIKFTELLVSQFNMIAVLEKRIGAEIKKAAKGLPSGIRIKVNNLEDPHIISLLYKAGRAGVAISLMVRSVCCIVPAIAGMSENITVRRIVDRFLEHSRLFIFGAGEDAVVFMGSADLMTRNLHHRVELCVPVKDARCKKELLDYFDMQWKDNGKAVQQMPDQQYLAVHHSNGHTINAQHSIYQYLKQRV